MALWRRFEENMDNQSDMDNNAYSSTLLIHILGMQTVTVYHMEPHTCSFKPSVVQNDDPITEAIQENADFGPTWITIC